MPEDPPIVGRLDESPEEPELDGVVLFNPAPAEPRDDLEIQPESRRPSLAMLAVVGAVLLLGGFQLYTLLLRQPVEAAPPPPTALTPDASPADSTPSLVPLGGTSLAGRAGSTILLEVRALRGGSAPLADTLVRFELVDGTGDLQELGRTDADGIARTPLQLPTRVGTSVVEASLAGTGLTTRMIIDARAGPPETLVKEEGDEQGAMVGELLPARVQVRITDAAGNPVPAADVRFTAVTGGGQVAPSRMRTDSLGIASAIWRLGMTPGAQELTAVAPEVGTTVTFTASAEPRPVAVVGGAVITVTEPVRVEPNPLVLGGSHVCVLAGRSPVCRGADERGQQPPVDGSFVALSSGISHTCGLDAEGAAQCWGANDGGQLGDGSRTYRGSPVPVRTELRFSELTAGAAHTCGLTAGGVPVCWGQNLSGQLGNGTRTDARSPLAVGGGLTFSTLVAGWSHTCGLTTNGNAFCWGLNSNGQLGDGSRLDRLVPTMVIGSIESLTAGSAHTCGVSQGSVRCWGDNRYGQLGDGTTQGRDQPVTVSGLPVPATEVAAGAVHTCALVRGGAAYCWGQNLHGQLGDGTTTNRSTAVPVAGGLTFRSIHAGGALTCALAADGAQYCWGLNQSGQLGDGTRESRSIPTRVGE